MDSTDESHVQDSLGLYVLGALDAAERMAVERHLAACAQCRAESEDFADTVAAVALLSEQDSRAIIDEFGIRRAAPEAGSPVGSATDAAPAAAPDRPDAPPSSADQSDVGSSPSAPDQADAGSSPSGPDHAEAAPSDSTPDHAEAAPSDSGSDRSGAAAPETPRRPTDPARGPRRRPPGGTGPRTRRPGTRAAWVGRVRRQLRTPSRGVVGIGSLVIVVLVSAGVFLGLVNGHQSTGQQGARVSVTLAATAEAPAGATLSVVAVGREDGVTVRATVRGLRPGVGYTLYVVTANGASHQAARWVGSAGAREITAQLPVALTELSFFTVARSDDGTPVVSAAVPR